MICMLLAYLTVHAQFTSVNSFLRKEIVSYIKNENGFYIKNVNKMTDVVVGVVESYAYDKKAQNLYVLTESSNVVVTLTKDYAKIIKRNKGIPQLSGEELDKEVQMRTKLLNDKYESLNREREQQIVDSIKKARQEEIDSINKAIQDSIDKANRLQAMIEAQAEYRRTHEPYDVPLGNVSLKCDICDKTIDSKDITSTFGIRNDSIYYTTNEEGKLGLYYAEAHQSEISSSFKSNKDFEYHYEVFKDCLTQDSIDYALLARYFCYQNYADYWKQLKKAAPYGYVEDWNWDDTYGMVSFDICYTNTNPKTIKYLTVYFKITNDVGDVRKTGYFKGTGPLKEGETASWDWDTSSYFTSGDSTTLSITKLVLTYMNGTTQVVSGKYLKFN